MQGTLVNQKYMNLPKEVVITSNLAENIYVTFICLLNCIPVYLVGKPGTSKSMAVANINQHMRGKESESRWWKKLFPSITVFPYQGSDVSTSQGIEDVFEKAKRYYETTNKNDAAQTIVTVHIDEIGLAEASPNNPLKVLHSYLEPGIKEKRKIAVIGLSNFQLDAAKMSRGITVNSPPPAPSDFVKIAYGMLKQSDSFYNAATKQRVQVDWLKHINEHMSHDA